LNWPRRFFFPQRANPYMEVAMCWHLLKANERALHLLDQAVDLPDFLAVTLAGYGTLDGESGRRYEVVSTRANTYHLRAKVHLDMGNLAAAASDYDAALRYYDGLSDAHFQRGKLALTEGDFERALQHMLRARMMNTSTSANWIGLAQVGVGLLDEALRAYDEALNEKPGNTLLHYWRSLVRIERDVFDDAIFSDLEASARDGDTYDHFYKAFWAYVVYDARGAAQEAAHAAQELDALWDKYPDRDSAAYEHHLYTLLRTSESPPAIPDHLQATSLSNMRYYLRLLTKLYPTHEAIHADYERVKARIAVAFIEDEARDKRHSAGMADDVTATTTRLWR
jgi:tetratricopeptide (TPR) repeat protein